MTTSQHQTMLDGSITYQPCVLPFSSKGLIDYLVQLIVTEDEAFLLLDKPAFHDLLIYLCPALNDRDIPHCTKIHEETLECAVQDESNVKVALQVCSKLTFT